MSAREAILLLLLLLGVLIDQTAIHQVTHTHIPCQRMDSFLLGRLLSRFAHFVAQEE